MKWLLPTGQQWSSSSLLKTTHFFSFSPTDSMGDRTTRKKNHAKPKLIITYSHTMFLFTGNVHSSCTCHFNSSCCHNLRISNYVFRIRNQSAITICHPKVQFQRENVEKNLILSFWKTMLKEYDFELCFSISLFLNHCICVRLCSVWKKANFESLKWVSEVESAKTLFYQVYNEYTKNWINWTMGKKCWLIERN